MNGRIWVDSVYNEGSTFTFEIELSVSDTPVSHIEKKQKQDTQITKEALHVEKKIALFKQLKESTAKRRPHLCEPILAEIDHYHLEYEDEILYKNVKSLIKKYKFEEAGKLL